MSSLLEIEGLQTQFFTSAGTVKAVDGISYNVEEGETVAVVGESGCGKSVSALSILRLVADPPGKIVGGSIRFQGRDLLQLSDMEMRSIRGNDIAMVFQEPMTSLNPVLTIGLQLTETLQHHLGMSDEDARPLLSELIQHGVKDEFVTRLHWEPGTLAVWDNRSTQHYALNDYSGHRREMLRVVIEGDRPV